MFNLGTDLVISKEEIILITGVNGYVGSHVADQALAAGYRVRGVVRNKEKSQWLQETFDERYGHSKFGLVEVADPLQVGALDSAAQGISGLVHVATVLPLSTEPDPYIADVTALTINALRSAEKQPSVKRVVITSSPMAAADPAPNIERMITVDSWNEKALKQAWEPPFGPDNMWDVYGASKANAEKEAWRWMAEKKPHFVLNSILPNTNFGPTVSRRVRFTSTSGMLKSVYDGDAGTMTADSPQYFVDIRDTARLHLIALVAPEVQNERLFAFAEPYNWNDILRVFRELYPERDFPQAPRDLGKDISHYPRQRATELLRAFGQSEWISLEQSIKDTMRDE